MNARDTRGIPKSNLMLPNLTYSDLSAERFTSTLRDIRESHGIAFSLQVRTGGTLTSAEDLGKNRNPVCLGNWAIWPQEWH